MGKRVAVMLRCHARPQLLDRVLRYYLALNHSEVRVEVSLMADRPTRSVEKVIRVHEPYIFQLLRCPFPIVSFDGGNRFMEAANYQYTKIQVIRPDWVIFADDDRWFEPKFRYELREVVDDDTKDMWYARSLFFWEEGQIRTDFFDHNSVALFRYVPGDVYPDDSERHIQAPAGLHDAALQFDRYGQLGSRLLDYGYCGAEERQRVFEEFKAVGRLDQVILKLFDEDVKLEPYGTTQST